jgi:hypothetical protein
VEVVAAQRPISYEIGHQRCLAVVPTSATWLAAVIVPEVQAEMVCDQVDLVKEAAASAPIDPAGPVRAAVEFAPIDREDPVKMVVA